MKYSIEHITKTKCILHRQECVVAINKSLLNHLGYCRKYSVAYAMAKLDGYSDIDGCYWCCYWYSSQKYFDA